MADEQSSNDPTENPNRIPPLVEQAEMRQNGETDSDQKKTEAQKTFNDVHWITHATFWSQIGLGIIGIWALIIYNGQLNQMRIATEASTHAVEVANETMEYNNGNFDRAMQRTIDQTTSQYEAAKAAKRAADIARDSLTTVQRAFVAPTLTIKSYQSPAEKYPSGMVIQVQWENSGATPTRNLAMHSSNERGQIPPPDINVDRWNSGDARIPIKAFIAPKGSVYSPAIDISTSEAMALAKGGTHVYIWGWTNYNDIFSNTPLHRTQYCYDLSFGLDSSQHGAPYSVVNNSSDCPKGNCADDECKVK